MITETDDAAYFNEIANDPKVIDRVRGELEGPIDVTPLFQLAGAVGLRGDNGGFILIPNQEDGLVFNCHSFFAPQENRAERALADTREAIDYSFETGEAKELRAVVPLDDEATNWLLKSSGWRSRYFDQVKNEALYGITKDEWKDLRVPT